MFVTGREYVSQNEPLKPEVRAILNNMTAAVDDYLIKAVALETDLGSTGEIELEKLLIVQSMLANIVDYVKQTGFIEDTRDEETGEVVFEFTDMLDTMREGLFNL